MFNYNKKPPKIKCEVCGELDSKILDHHHIVPRTDPNSNNNGMNLAVLCASCHRKHHTGSLHIIGVFPSTSGRILIYEIDGKKNLDIDVPYYIPKAKEKVSYDETAQSDGIEQKSDSKKS